MGKVTAPLAPVRTAEIEESQTSLNRRRLSLREAILRTLHACVEKLK